jgi:DNA polymerase III alpha subunit (gram-positive type)
MARFVSIDIETGGLDPLIHPITEVGMVIEDLNRGISKVEFSLPFDPEACDPVALEVQGWGKRDLPKRWDRARAAGFIHESTRDAHIVGKNPWFDTSFISELLENFLLTPLWHHRLVDVGSLAWGWYNGIEDCMTSTITGSHIVDPPNSVRVGELVGIPIDSQARHAAMYDAEWAYDVFRKIVPV